ncbi:hypothetical protein NDU88_001966, partial [Pleurodeles waltl]
RGADYGQQSFYPLPPDPASCARRNEIRSLTHNRERRGIRLNQSRTFRAGRSSRRRAVPRVKRARVIETPTSRKFPRSLFKQESLGATGWVCVKFQMCSRTLVMHRCTVTKYSFEKLIFR